MCIVQLIAAVHSISFCTFFCFQAFYTEIFIRLDIYVVLSCVNNQFCQEKSFCTSLAVKTQTIVLRVLRMESDI